MKKLFFIIFTLYISISFISCNYKSSYKVKNSSDTLLAKQIIFPGSLLKLEGLKGVKIDSLLDEIAGKIKIISIVDGACVKCITNQLNYTDSLFGTIVENNDIQLIFVLNVLSEDSVYFMRHTQSAISANGTVLWDNNYNFEKENKLFSPDENLRTFMINSENKIVMYGNPVLNPDIINDYRRFLNEDDKLF